MLFVVGTYLDFTASVKFKYYDQTEANPLFQDDFGYFHLKRAAITYAALLIASLVLAFLWHPAPGALLPAIAGVKGLILGLNNRKNAQNNRVKQYAKLDGLKHLVNTAQPTDNYFAALASDWRYIDERGFYKTFGWVRINALAGEAGAKVAVQKELVRIVGQPREKWFST